MSDNTVRFKIKIDGIDGFKEAEISAENLGDVISGVINKAEGLAKALAGSDKMTQALEQATSVVRELQSSIQRLTESMERGFQSTTQRIGDSVEQITDTAKEGVEELRDTVNGMTDGTDRLRNSLINCNQAVQAFEQIGSAIRGLQSDMHSLTDTYAVQAQAETRLSTVMRNTMEAAEADIQSIKDLASAQQDLGVVGDEVQLSGAQELATYLGKKESLETLIPVMNDMIAQQYGYNSSAESAVQIATMMGKVMEGQVNALSRYGYSFTEAQEQILKFGTEEERAATLAEVIEESVGGVNAALAATDYGKIVQANNKLGDMKEYLGALVAPAMTAVDSIANVSIALAGIGKGITTINSLNTALKGTALASKLTATAERMLAKSGMEAAVATNTLKITVIGLQTALTAGLMLAVWGLIELFSLLARNMGGARKAAEDFAKASEEARNHFEAETSELNNLIGVIQDETAARTDQVAAIETLKDRYPELVEKYIDEQGHITNLIGLQKELNRLRAGERIQAESDKLEEYKAELEKYRKLQKVANVAGRFDGVGAGARLFLTNKVEYWEEMVARQQAEVDRNKSNEWKAKLKESTPQELEALRELYGQKNAWSGQPFSQPKLDDIEKEMESRKEAKPTQNKAYWENIRKQKQAEYDALDKFELESEKALAIRGEIETATANIALFDTKSNAGKSPEKKENKAYKTAVQASEKEQHKKLAAINEQYLNGGISDKEEYESQLQQVTIEGLENQLRLARKYGEDTSRIEQSIAEAKIRQKESSYDRELAKLNTELDEEKLAVSVSLADRQITQEEADAILLEAELANALKRKELAADAGKEITDIEREIMETRIKLGENGYKAELKQLDDNLAIQKATLTRRLIDGLVTQEQYDRLILVEMEKYYKARLNLATAYGKAETGDTQAWLDAQLNLSKFDKSASDNKAGKTGTPLKNAGNAWSGVKGVADSFREIKSAIKDTDNAWDALTKTVDGFIGVFRNVTSVIESIKNITEATRAMATANTAAAATGAASSVASVPFAGPALAVTAVASVIAALSGLPKFADGGIVYGPTIGLMGEYAGAKSNPEVIAPLSKLQGLLSGQQGHSEVRFRIEGRELVGILNKQNNIYQRNA